ncbi:MAG: BTAD domain-containing putative transcriptional regulator [Caldilineaceae bacterium]
MKLEIFLFGGLRVVVNDEAITTFMSAKAPALLAYVAATGRVHRRDDLAALLWSDLPEADAKNNLRQVLTNLRRFVEPFLIITRETVAMNRAASIYLDVACFDAHLSTAAARPPDEQMSHRQTAIALYTGDFLAGFFVREAPTFEEWLLAQRAHYRERALHLLHTLTQAHLNQGDYAQAIHSATRLLALDGWREEAHCQLMLALARSGQRSAALTQYKICRQVLEAELGVEPAAETTALYERIRSALTAPRHNLPAAVTGFVGRTVEMAAIRRLLLTPETRLLTILGPGGIGKTRLALEVGATCEPTFLNGVWFVSLAAVQRTDAEGLARAVADALGCTLAGPTDPKAQLLTFLQARELLIILDNMETMTDAAAWLSETLAKAPDVTILATSRERLNLQAEQVYLLEGLPVPTTLDATDEAFAAVQLFEQCARRVQPDFVCTESEAGPVTQICRAVQGLPLGIELAAAWVHQLSCAEIAAEIERGLDFLATTRHDVPPRQRTLRALFDWSWRRLTNDEQTLFAQLALFRGPFTRAAATQVAHARFPVLAALVNQSLLWRRGTTYQLHEVMRHFADEKLAESGARPATAARHATYYGGFLAQQEARLKSSAQKQALQEIDQEVENVRAAWQWLVEQRNVQGIAAAVGAFYHFLMLKSWFREGVEAFQHADQALQAVAARDPLVQLTCWRLMVRAARFHSSLAQYAEAQSLLTAGLAALRQLGATEEVAFTLGHLGGTARMQGDLDRAEYHLQECLSIRRQLNDHWGQAVALLDLAGVAHMREVYPMARDYCEAGLRAAEQAGDSQITTHLLTGLSITHRQLGDYAQAEHFGRRSLASYEELGDNYGIMQATLTLGELNRQLGNDDNAEPFFCRAIEVAQAIGDRSGEADGYCGLGQIALNRGAVEQALLHLRQALALAHEIQETILVLDILLEIACLPAAGDPSCAGNVLRFLSNHPQLPEQRRRRAADALERLQAAGYIPVAKFESVSDAVAQILRRAT